jgi:hypothetical protein
MNRLFRKTILSIAVITAISSSGALIAATKTFQSSHVFNYTDLVGDFNGTTYASVEGNTTGTGNGGDPSIICGMDWSPTSPACDEDHAPIPGDEAWQLYPIDSEFGFQVVPFAKAIPKVRGDGVWGEGYIGVIRDPATKKVIGVEVSDAETDTFVVPAGLGTWCSGLGGASVKCSTEHFVTMEHVLTCHETIPYYYANEETGAQLEIKDPADANITLVDCADSKLDNNLVIHNLSSDRGDALTYLNDHAVGEIAYSPTGENYPVVDWATISGWADPDDVLTWLEPNESTVLDDIAVGRSYSITAKDDGKPLYRWGNLIKRPNDIRLFARFALPSAWQTAFSLNDGNGYHITKARLIINHKVTNNPNDQLRPEDMENEAAIGRQPGYDFTVIAGEEARISDVSCFEGDGLEIPAETVLQNPHFAIGDTAVPPPSWTNDPYAWSEDLREGFTNAWYTTVDREPFEWSYDTDNDGAADESYRAPLDPDLGDTLPVGYTQLSGPRWRLTPPKFGQDIPGLEIPKTNCAPPPYQKEMIKYDVGELATETDSGPGPTIIDLLDWSPSDERSIVDPDSSSDTYGQKVLSPLAYSNGWVGNGTTNDGTVVNWDVDIVNPKIKAVTVNGAPVTQGFDLSIYIKGDRKPTALYNARLEIEWDDGL